MRGSFGLGLDDFDARRCFGCSFNYGFGNHFCSRLFSYRCSNFNLYGSSWGFGGFAGQTLGFTLTTTHFARIVRRATGAADGNNRGSFGCYNFSYYGFGNRLGCGNHGRRFNNLCNRSWRLYNSRCWCNFADFSGIYRCFAGFDNRAACCFYNYCLNSGLWRFSGSDFAWLLLLDNYRCCFGCLGCFT